MTKYNKIVSFSLFVLLALLISSCYKEPDFIGDNSKTEGKHFPVIAGFNIIESYSNGSSTEFVVEYYNRKTNSYLSQMSAGCMPFGGEWTCAKID